MSASSWTGGAGDWGDRLHWSGGVPDLPTTDAVIDAAGTYTVTIGSGESFTAGVVKLDAPGATLEIEGALQLNGSLAVAAGGLDLAGGVLEGGSLVTGGHALSSDFGTLDAVHVVGPLDIEQNLAWLIVKDGLSVTSPSGAPGRIDLSGSFATLEFAGSQDFDNAAITLGSYGPLYDGDFILATGRLVLGSHVAIVSSGDRAIATIGGTTVVDYGSILEKATDGLFTIDADAFTNDGSIEVAGRSGALVADGHAFTNGAAGVITVGDSGYFALGGAKTTFDNQGVIIVDAGGVLGLAGSFSLATLGDIENHGVLDFDGVLANGGEAVRFGARSLGGAVVFGGTIVGGAVSAAPGARLDWAGGTLDGAAYEGALDLGPGPFETAIFENGVTLTGPGGRGRGLVRLDGPSSTLVFAGDQTFDDATILLGGAAGGPDASDQISLQIPTGSKVTTLTLGAHSIVSADAAGRSVRIDEEDGAGVTAEVVSDGLIEAAGVGGGLTIQVDRFVNNGRVTVADGDTLRMETGRFVNNGLVSVGKGASLVLGVDGAAAFRNDGRISVAIGGTLDATGNYTAASLAGVHVAGTFAIDGLLDNAGAVVRPGAGPLFGGRTVLGSDGEIDGGRLILGGGPIAWDGGDLRDVTVQGAMNLTGPDARVFLLGGVALTGATGAGRGAIDLTGAGAILDFIGSQTLDNATLAIGASGESDTIELFTIKVAPQVLTLGSRLTILADAANSDVSMRDSYPAPDTIVIDGTLAAGARGGTLTVSVRTLENNGLAAVSNGDTLVVDGALTGAGAVTIAGARAVLGAVAAGQSVLFEDGAGVLELTDADRFAATLAGFRKGDILDLAGVAANAYALTSSDRLVLTEDGTTVAAIQLAGHYGTNAFRLASDGAGGTMVTAAGAPQAQLLAQAMAAFAPETFAASPGAPSGGWEATPMLAPSPQSRLSA